ncbi:MAG: hypothetical protein K1W02_07270 [Muribaculaceae bacterium]
MCERYGDVLSHVEEIGFVLSHVEETGFVLSHGGLESGHGLERWRADCRMHGSVGEGCGFSGEDASKTHEMEVQEVSRQRGGWRPGASVTLIMAGNMKI